MAAATGLVITKRFTYRGDATEEWSNKYWLTGDPPSSSAGWKTLFDQLVNIEKACYTSASSVVGGIGYADNTPGAHAVWTVDLDVNGPVVPGTLTPVAGMSFAGDQAGMLEWRTERKNSRGKWIYLRKYFHGGMNDSTNPDLINTGTHDAYTTLGAALFSGTWPGARKVRSQKQDEVLTATVGSWNVTTRSLKRRGKRPKAESTSMRALGS